MTCLTCYRYFIAKHKFCLLLNFGRHQRHRSELSASNSGTNQSHMSATCIFYLSRGSHRLQQFKLMYH